jgi:pimeloyl-ACP methyl ester carboxylesterase
MPIQPVNDEYVIAGEMTLHYIQWGNEGTPVVCVHGLTANAFCFQALADTLAPDHRVFAYDLRGRGDSDRPENDYSVPTHADDLLELLDSLGLDNPIIVGHSLGAAVALYFAAHYPERISKLVLLDGGAPLWWKTPEETPRWLVNAALRLGKPLPSYKAYIEQLRELPYLGPYWNDYLELYFKHDVRPGDTGGVVAKADVQAIAEEGRRAHEARLDEQWSHVQAPTLLLRAEQQHLYENDQLMSEEMAEQIQRGIANCLLIKYPSLNHYTLIFGVQEKPMQDIREFIES